MSEHASTWITFADEVDRGNQLGAANLAAERVGRLVATVLEGSDQREAAIASGRESGLLLLPEANQVLPEPGAALALVQQARDEGWRLMLLSLGIDSDSGELAERMLGGGPDAGSLPKLPPVPEVDSPVPPPELRRVVSVGTEANFLSSGAMHVETYDLCLREAGGPIAEATDILDWGAGCGRMTIFLAAKAPGARITAADTDPTAIAWVGENLDVAAAVALPLLPPTELGDDAFDRVVGHSVFSHLEVEPQDRWLAELARITRPGGYLAVSFHGPLALRWHLYHPLIEMPDSIEADLARDGIAIWRGDGWEDHFYEGYHTTFHTHDYIREHWSQWFEVVGIHEGMAAPTQDIAVLRPR
jgi:SAM-dependent methyltransferase